MSRQYWEELIWWATADGSPIASTTTETVIFPNTTIPGNYMSDGRVIRVTQYGRLSTTATPTVRFRMRWGGVSGTVIWDSGTITCGSGVTAALWFVCVDIQTRTNGAAGSLFATGTVIIGSALAPTVGSATGAAAVGVFGSAGDDTPIAVGSLDLTVDTAFATTAAWSASSASNTLTGHNYFGESLN